MEEGRKARRVLVLLVASEAIAVVALHRLGGVDGFAIPRHDLGRWLQQSTSEDVLLAGVRLVALVAAWWLHGSTLLYVVARVARLRGAARALGWATLPAVRRWADRAAAVSIVAATALGAGRPAAADPPPTTAPVMVDVDHRDPRSVPSRPSPSIRTGLAVDPLPVPTGTTSPPPPTSAPLVPPAAPPPAVPVVPVVPPAPVAPLPAPTAGATHTVATGEHLWSIAAGQVATATGKPPAGLSPAEIAPYWRRVVELNLHRLRSGNPNLVYPGEVVELPPV